MNKLKIGYGQYFYVNDDEGAIVYRISNDYILRHCGEGHNFYVNEAALMVSMDHYDLKLYPVSELYADIHYPNRPRCWDDLDDDDEPYDGD